MDENNVQVNKNPNKGFDFHKVFAAIGIILVVAIVVLAGVWYFVEGQNSGIFNDEDTGKISTSSAKTSTKSATKSATQSGY